MALATRSDGFLTLLKKKNFLRIWLAQLISMTSFNAANYALLVLIENITHSTTLVGLAIISFSLPAILFGAPAGVFVDRMNKRRVLWASNCFRALATLLFVLFLLFDRKLLLPIYLLTFIISTIGQFFTPAEGAAIPMLVSEDELMPALSLFNITFMLAQALGFILLAPIALALLPTISIASVMIDAVAQLNIIIALLYLLCAGLIVLMPSDTFVQKSPARRRTGPVTTETLGVMSNVWSEIYQGWSFVRSNKPLFLAVIELSFAGVLLLVIGQLATPIVTHLLRLPANAMAFVFAPAGIGLVLGSVLMPGIIERLGKSYATMLGIALLTLATMLLPLTTLLAQLLNPKGWNHNPLLLIGMACLMFIAGFALDFINIPAQTAMQELTPDWIKGRVLALQMVLYNACSIPIIIFIGAVADLFGLDRVLYLLSISELAFGIWGIYYERKHGIGIHPAEMQKQQDEKESDKITS